MKALLTSLAVSWFGYDFLPSESSPALMRGAESESSCPMIFCTAEETSA